MKGSLPPDPLARAIAAIAADLPESTYSAILAVLDAHPSCNAAILKWQVSSVAAGSTVKPTVSRLLTYWSQRPEVPALAIGLALRTARLSTSGDRNDIDLVWTGPPSSEVPTRRTDQILLKLIEDSVSELLIVSFAVHEGQRWIGALVAAVERGVKVTFVVETAASGKVTKDGLNVLGSELLAKINVLTWDLTKRPLDPHGKIGTLHAKCAVADRRMALISSANLTEFALTLNMELGVTIESGVHPLRIAALFDDLNARGYLTRVSI